MSIAALNVENIAGDKDFQARIDDFRSDVITESGYQATVTVTDGTDGTASFSIQITDCNGDAITSSDDRALARIWVAATAYAAPADLGSETISTGTTIQEVTTDAHFLVLADASGVIAGSYDRTTDGALHVMVELGGRVFTGNATVSGN